MSGPRERTVGVAGVSCRVWEQGDGEPIAFLAGVGGLPRWTPFLQRLARTRRVIAPSLPGSRERTRSAGSTTTWTGSWPHTTCWPPPEPKERT